MMKNPEKGGEVVRKYKEKEVVRKYKGKGGYSNLY